MKAITFNGFDLQSGPYRVVDVGELFNSPIRDIIAEELARSDNAVAVFRKYTSRKYTLSGNVRDVSSAALESAIDALKLNLLGNIGQTKAGWGSRIYIIQSGDTLATIAAANNTTVERLLELNPTITDPDVIIDGDPLTMDGYRYFESECQNVSISRGATDLTRAGWSAQFYMPIPFSTDGSTETLASVTGATTPSQQLPTTNIGTYLGLPYITLTITALEPNISDVDIVIGNPSSGEYITISDTFADGDTVIIDTVNKQVFHNSQLINPVGNFPAWAPGNGLLDYSDSGTTRTISLTATYEPRYL